MEFLGSTQQMERESQSLDHLIQDDEMAALFRLIRGPTVTSPVELPWLDVDRSFFIATAQHAGDDTAVALDYRTSSSNPRVIASDIWTSSVPYAWRTVKETVDGRARRRRAQERGEGVWPGEAGDIHLGDMTTGGVGGDLRPEAGWNQQLTFARAGGREPAPALGATVKSGSQPSPSSDGPQRRRPDHEGWTVRLTGSFNRRCHGPSV
ncbi:hypothetical protein [Paractinoplanes toevensis]|uniref:hypothetical protein n=1 Tax=Paractinoplanes toevensis TaxID=571911 RepID=UPI001BB32AC8|nr:hypothetical protein [Actinoplanes toevensis]